MSPPSVESVFQLLLSQFNDYNLEFEKSIEAQNNNLSEVTSKLVTLSQIISIHGDRLTSLEKTYSLLARDMEMLRGYSTLVSQSDTRTEIILGGIPLDLVDSPSTIVGKVLEALGAPELSSEILEIRRVVPKLSAMNNVTACSSKTLIVKLKSSLLCDHIVSLKRSKGDLPVSDVFESTKHGNIYVNEFLPHDIYEL